MDNTNWYVFHNQQQLGPFSESAIKQKLFAGEITRDDLVWAITFDQWKPIKDIPIFTTPPPLPPLPPQCFPPLPLQQQVSATSLNTVLNDKDSAATNIKTPTSHKNFLIRLQIFRIFL